MGCSSVVFLLGREGKGEGGRGEVDGLWDVRAGLKMAVVSV